MSVSDKYSNHFDDAQKLIIKEMEQVDSLYFQMEQEIKETKENSKRTKRGSGSSPHTYLYNMYANMTSAKTSKIQLIKELVTVKKIIADLAIKDDKAQQTSDNWNAVAQEIVKALSSQENQVIDFTDIQALTTDSEEEQLKKLALIEAEKIGLTNDRIIEGNESAFGSNTILALNIKTEECYELDKEYEITKDITDEVDLIIKRNKKTGEIESAFDRNSARELELVFFDDE